MVQFKTWNSTLWNQWPWNGGSSAELFPTSDDDISFYGYGLQNDLVVTETVDIWSTADRDLNSDKVPNDHGRIINSDFYNTKVLEFTGMLNQSTRTALDDLIFDFKKGVSRKAGNLDVKLADGTIRRFICTATEVFVDRIDHYRLTSCPFRVRFECYTPFGEDTAYTSSNFEVTVDSFIEVMENPGNAPGRPVWLVVLEGTMTASQINVISQTTDQKISISGSFVAGDIIIFDGENSEVTVNSSTYEFDGTFPELQSGSNSFRIDVTGSNIEYELTWKTLGKYL